jgi:site-specific recombinase
VVSRFFTEARAVNDIRHPNIVEITDFGRVDTGTIWYAMVTGVILWLSSVIGGWVDNFAVYRRLPQAIAEHRLGRVLGERTMRWMGRAFARSLSSIAGCVALGFMLGMCPIVGKFFGLPLDVRHVTLSTGTLALGASALGRAALSDPGFWWSVAGIGTIFVCNLGVSFNLALAVALRAREATRGERWQLASALLRRALRHPGDFIRPPRRGESAPAGVAHH